MNIGYSASGPHGGVRLKRHFVGGLDFFGRGCESAGGVALLSCLFRGFGSHRAHVLIEILLLGEGLLGGRPIDAHGFGGANGGPFVFRDDADEIAFGYGLDIA